MLKKLIIFVSISVYTLARLTSVCPDNICTDTSLENLNNTTNLTAKGLSFEGLAFSGFTLNNANLQGSSFKGASFSSSNFESCNLKDSNFNNATFLNGNSFNKTNFKRSTFVNTIFKDSVNFTNAKNLSLDGAQILDGARVILPDGTLITTGAEEDGGLYGCYSGCNIFEVNGEYYTKVGMQQKQTALAQEIENLKYQTYSTQDIHDLLIKSYSRALVPKSDNIATIANKLNGIGFDFDNIYRFLGMGEDEGINMSSSRLEYFIKKKISRLKRAHGDEYKGINFNELGRQLGELRDPAVKQSYDDYLTRLQNKQFDPITTMKKINPQLNKLNNQLSNIREKYASFADVENAAYSLPPDTGNDSSGGFGSLIGQGDEGFSNIDSSQLVQNLKYIISQGADLDEINVSVGDWIAEQNNNGTYDGNTYTEVQYNNGSQFYDPNGNLIDESDIPFDANIYQTSIDDDLPIDTGTVF